jgi:phospholipid/cholesterol/gamma-HCH transport system substrate-binding protein
MTMGRKVLVGFLLLGALFVFGLGTFYVKNWQFLIGKGYVLRTHFDRAQTLDTGDVVRMAGVIVGSVKSINIDTEVKSAEPVTVELFIRSGVKVRAQDEAVIRIGSLFGGNYVEIKRGDPNAPSLLDGDTIRKTSVSPSISEVVEASTEAISNVNKAFEDINKMTSDIAEGKGALGRLISDKDLSDKLTRVADDATSIMDSLKGAADRVNKGEGLLGKVVMDDKMASDFQSIAENAKGLTANINAISADLKAGKGTMGKLLTDETLYTDAKDVFALFRDGDGLIPRLLKDKDLSNSASQTIDNLRDVTDKINKGESSLGKLLSSTEAYDKLNASLDNLKTFTSDLANGQGTIGKLVKDDKVYTQITQILNDVQGLLETYREQSPVISFAGAVFGAF